MSVGNSGDGGPATAASLYSPRGVSVDRYGNVYFAENLNNTVRKISATGIITTIAGTGSAGFSGDGGPATAAELNYPEFVAVDAAGNIFIADNSNHRIRKIDASGIITTIAGRGTPGYSGNGGPAANAELQFPTCVTVDWLGNIYISDAGNRRVRKVDQSGTISLFAGSGGGGYYGDGGPATLAGLSTIYGLAVDTSGNVFICDPGAECIRKVDGAGIISTVAGNHHGAGTYMGGYAGDGGPATAAELNYAKYITVDKYNNLFIADLQNQRIRMVDNSGIITTVAGDGIPGYNGDGDNPISRELYDPNGVAFDSVGNLYIADMDNNRIRCVRYNVAAPDIGNRAVEFEVYPNPVTDELMIKTDNTVYCTVFISDERGKILWRQSVSGDIRTEVKWLPVGGYYVTLLGKEGVGITRQFVKQ